MSTKPTKKHVYFFGGGKAEGEGTMKTILGGKGAGLAEMTKIGLPVPAGFTITTEVCDIFNKNKQKYPQEIKTQIEENIKKMEKAAGKKFGDPSDPLLLSVRSGAAVSMPGMMETILNLGLNDVSLEGLAKKTKNRRFALDAYRRLIMMFGSTAMGIEREKFDHVFDEIKNTLTRKRIVSTDKRIADIDVSEQELEVVIRKFKELYKKELHEDFPTDPMKQLWGSIDAVFRSWMGEKAVKYREVEHITGLLGTAVNVQQMVFGNKGTESGTGVCFTRDPNTGKNEFYGDYLIDAQGEDVVAGVRTPVRLSEFQKIDPKGYKQLCDVRVKLEKHYKDMQDLEFTVEEKKLYILQCRSGKRSPHAAFQMAVDMAKEKLITKEVAVSRIKSRDIEGVFYSVIDSSQKEELKKNFLTEGIGAVPGAACGKIVFNAKDAEEAAARGESVILTRRETSPEDVGGMHAAQGIITSTGGKTSHAAVVARGWGKCCIVGVENMHIDYAKKTMTIGNNVMHEGDFLTLDGTMGVIYKGSLKLTTPTLPAAYKELMKWADEIRKIKIRTNADTGYDSEKAVNLGAEGIGLCRTEHMFFDSEDRRFAIQEMIVADTTEARVKALDKLLPFQIDDFKKIFTAMNGFPVTIRLIDPPLHEFAPHGAEAQMALAKKTGIAVAHIEACVAKLHESNPMLGHRGCRLAMTYPEIQDMQTKAIIEAALFCQKKGIKVFPEIMIPFTIDAKEFKILSERIRKQADEMIKKAGVKLNYMVGTMIEIPRAALLADKIAEYADFFSCGTNDLTQMTMGMSRDDAGKFLPDYVMEKKYGIFAEDPFQSLDQEGVGMLVKMALEKGRKTKKDLKVGICGEHGGETKSVKFCCSIGMNYVSCSPLRVPIARLAAAQYEIEKKAKGTTKKK